MKTLHTLTHFVHPLYGLRHLENKAWSFFYFTCDSFMDLIFSLRKWDINVIFEITFVIYYIFSTVLHFCYSIGGLDEISVSLPEEDKSVT